MAKTDQEFERQLDDLSPGTRETLIVAAHKTDVIWDDTIIAHGLDGALSQGEGCHHEHGERKTRACNHSQHGLHLWLVACPHRWCISFSLSRGAGCHVFTYQAQVSPESTWQPDR